MPCKWHYRNVSRIFDPNPFKPKSKFNLPKSDAATELYLSRLEKKLDKGSVVVVWDKEDYLKETEEQLSCKEMYQGKYR